MHKHVLASWFLLQQLMSSMQSVANSLVAAQQ